MLQTDFQLQTAVGLAPKYEHLLELDRAGWAWEWLRRNPDFVSLKLTSEVNSSVGRAFLVRQAHMSERAFLKWGLHYG